MMAGEKGEAKDDFILHHMLPQRSDESELSTFILFPESQTRVSPPVGMRLFLSRVRVLDPVPVGVPSWDLAAQAPEPLFFGGADRGRSCLCLHHPIHGFYNRRG